MFEVLGLLALLIGYARLVKLDMELTEVERFSGIPSGSLDGFYLLGEQAVLISNSRLYQNGNFMVGSITNGSLNIKNSVLETNFNDLVYVGKL